MTNKRSCRCSIGISAAFARALIVATATASRFARGTEKLAALRRKSMRWRGCDLPTRKVACCSSRRTAHSTAGCGAYMPAIAHGAFLDPPERVAKSLESRRSAASGAQSGTRLVNMVKAQYVFTAPSGAMRCRRPFAMGQVALRGRGNGPQASMWPTSSIVTG